MRLKLLEKCGILFASHKERSLGRDTKRQVVSLYGKAGGIGDFFVLDEIPDGNVYRLMLLNREWDLGMHLLKVGAMLRVSADRICAFRSIKGARTARYA